MVGPGFISALSQIISSQITSSQLNSFVARCLADLGLGRAGALSGDVGKREVINDSGRVTVGDVFRIQAEPAA